jgi:hypothetical protein
MTARAAHQRGQRERDRTDAETYLDSFVREERTDTRNACQERRGGAMHCT